MTGLLAVLRNRLPEFQSTLAEHFVVLTLIPVSAAILIALPLAFVVYNRPVLRSIALGLSNIVQTIPSLAMLAFLLPLAGIGKLPAIIALTLYAILPILQNAITALRELPESVLESADGIGFSRLQRLQMVELPLSLPLIVGGIRTATTICVGVATLSTFIGAGGLGDFINRGLSLNRMSLLLLGASAAALLALCLDFLLATIGAALAPGTRPARMSWRFGFCGFLLALLLGFTLWPVAGSSSQGDDDASGLVRIGSKNFTEQIVLGELLALWIEQNTNLRVERYLNLGGTVICHQALTSGEIDLYIEYTGTALLTLLDRPRHPSASPEDVVEQLNSAYGEQYDCAVLPPLGFENTYALSLRREMAEKNGWKTISDLSRSAPELRAGFTAEFMERQDGLPGLSEAYELSFQSLHDLGPELMYAAVDSDEVDVIGAFSTDGRLIEFDLAVLEDDRRFFPPYQAVPVVRQESLRQFPSLESALRELAGKIDHQAITRLNHAVDVEKQDPRQAARAFLTSELFDKPSQSTTTSNK